MKIDELQKLVNVLGEAYNKVISDIQAQVTPTMDADDAVAVISMKKGAEATAAYMLHILLGCYGQKADMELGDKVYHLGGATLEYDPVQEGKGDAEG